MRNFTQLAEDTADAYSADRYANWTSVARMLLKRGFTDREAEAIMRSKWTRWAGDSSDAPYGRVPAKALSKYLDSMGESLAQEVTDLTRETFPEDAA